MDEVRGRRRSCREANKKIIATTTDDDEDEDRGRGGKTGPGIQLHFWGPPGINSKHSYIFGVPQNIKCI